MLPEGVEMLLNVDTAGQMRTARSDVVCSADAVIIVEFSLITGYTALYDFSVVEVINVAVRGKAAELLHTVIVDRRINGVEGAVSYEDLGELIIRTGENTIGADISKCILPEAFCINIKSHIIAYTVIVGSRLFLDESLAEIAQGDSRPFRVKSAVSVRREVSAVLVVVKHIFVVVSAGCSDL